MKPLIVVCALLCFSCIPAMTRSQDKLTRDKAKADSLHLLTRRLMQKGKQDSAALVINEGLIVAQKLRSDSMLCKFKLEKANLSNLRGDKKTGLQILQQEVAPLLNSSMPYSVYDRYYNLTGNCYRTLLQYDSAIHYFRLDEQLNNKHNPYGNWLVYYQMALTFMLANIPEQAEHYFWKSYAITKPGGKRMDHGVLLNEFATFLSKQNKPEKFAVILKEYSEFIRGGKKDFSLDPIHNMLTVDFSDSTLSGKVKFMTHVKQSLLRNGDTFNAAYANNYIARYYEDNRQPAVALQYIRENLSSFKPSNYPEYAYINTAVAYRLLKKMGRNDEAVHAADQLLKLKDSMAAGIQQEKIIELETRYQTARKENEIATLNAENAINEANLQREKKANILLLGGAVLLLLSVVAILYLYRQQKIKSSLIQKQADELEVLMKEIHHRVKNNMQIISSLLDLQSNTIKDGQAAEAVKEGKNRVQSMAIIHQQLYQEGNIRGIKMDDYITTLTQNIFSSYNINPDKISLATDIERLNLDVDTVIPLGLIINELVSNSLKYAFDHNGEGMVTISLKEREDCLELLVKDNGKGFPNGLNIYKTRSFGLQLITAFAQKLKAHLDFYNDNGAAVSMRIKKFRLATV